MSKWDHLIKRLYSIPSDMRFAEIRKILCSLGYKASFPSGGSSHCIFRKKGVSPIVIPCHEPIKKAYLKMVKAIVESELSSEKRS